MSGDVVVIRQFGIKVQLWGFLLKKNTYLLKTGSKTNKFYANVSRDMAVNSSFLLRVDYSEVHPATLLEIPKTKTLEIFGIFLILFLLNLKNSNSIISIRILGKFWNLYYRITQRLLYLLGTLYKRLIKILGITSKKFTKSKYFITKKNNSY